MVLRRLLGVAGAFTALGSLLFAVMAASELMGFGDGKTESPVLLALLIFFAATCFCGVWLVRWGFQRQPVEGAAPEDPHQQVRLVLNLAQAHNGELTLLQVASETGLNIEQSRKILEDLVAEGLAQMHVDEEGVMRYRFPDLRRRGG